MSEMPKRPRLPEWIRIKPDSRGHFREVDGVLTDLGLNTVCRSAKCPNCAECWRNRTATFMIMGDHCTRYCKFCNVFHGGPIAPLDPEEPMNVARAVQKLELKFAVITSVTRDDLPDGGAGHFAETIRAVRALNPGTKIEVLTSDCRGDSNALACIAEAAPDVYNHNIETVERITPQVRSVATYRNSLAVLQEMARRAEGRYLVKSGLMVGLGETDDEVVQTLADLYAHGVRLLTIGQYLPPNAASYPLDRYVHPDVFRQWHDLALKMGFSNAACGPLVRSSYQAHKLQA